MKKTIAALATIIFCQTVHAQFDVDAKIAQQTPTKKVTLICEGYIDRFKINLEAANQGSGFAVIRFDVGTMLTGPTPILNPGLNEIVTSENYYKVVGDFSHSTKDVKLVYCYNNGQICYDGGKALPNNPVTRSIGKLNLDFGFLRGTTDIDCKVTIEGLSN